MLDYTIKIPSINPFPVKLNMCDSVDCPACKINLSEELGIDLNTFKVDKHTTIYCKNCDLKINFKIVEI